MHVRQQFHFVPGMWWMLLVVMALAGVNGNSHPPLPCEEARFKCAQRPGCGMALQNYLTGCSSILQGYLETHCPEICQHSLIALTSTEEGKELMRCKCSDDFCEDSKRRVEICRPQVMIANRNETVVSCTVAHLICQADNSCSTALEYYDLYCKSMFHGRKCTHRCRNSINILRRQEKSAKLKTCKCDGNEMYDCPKIQKNMAKLCYHKKVPVPPAVTIGPHLHDIDGNTESNVIRQSGGTSGCGGVFGFGATVLVLLLRTLT